MIASNTVRRIGISLVACFWISSSVRSAEFAWQPTSASGTHVIVGNEIRLTGGGQRVILELKLSGWAPAQLATWQATLDPSLLGQECVGGGNEGAACFTDADCFGGGACIATRLGPVVAAVEPCAVDGDCTLAFNDPGARCDAPAGLCFSGWQDSQNRPDFVIQGGLPAVDVSTPEYRYGSSVLFGAPATDDGSIFYGGHLALDVPVTAAGSYTLTFLPVGADSFMIDSVGAPVDPIDLTPAIITVICETNADCNDNNACTTDVCQGNGVCDNQTNYDTANFCCNPTNGDLTALDDGNACTNNVCQADGSVSHPPLPEFTSCGDQGNFECDGPDSCDGAGNCLDRIEPPGAPCGDPTATDCNGADTCDGAGGCQPNIAPPDTPCGDPGSSQCDDPDSCNASGVCLPNNVPNGTACDDGLFCNVGEVCSGGACAGGTSRDCGDGLACTSDICNDDVDTCENPLDAGNCLISDVCYGDGAFNPANDCEACDPVTATDAWTLLADGSLCDDGDPCTGTGRPGIGDDTCTSGVCAGVPDPECNADCAFAIEAFVGTTTSNNTSGGPDDGEASCQVDSNNDVWFFYTALCSTTVFVSTTGSSLAPSNDTVLNVYDACPDDGGIEIACDDDSGVDLQSALTFPALAGETYYIRVAGFEDNTGGIALNIDFVFDCLIADTCYTAGDRDPTNDCMACVPQLSTTEWSPVDEGVACGDPNDDECDSPDACNGAGVCETNFKPDGIVCPDDGNDCTQDLCASGLCTHPPEAAELACGDQSDTECDNPDTCDGTGVCLDNFEASGFPCGDPTQTQCDNPDVCDGGGACVNNFAPDGTPCDDGDVCTGADACATGACAGTPIPEAPIVTGLGSLSIDVTPQPPGSAAPVALRVTSPDWPCIDKYIAVDGALVDTPAIQLPDDWGTINVPGPEIVPSSTYVVVAECGAFTTAPGSGDTWLWGDHDNSGVVDFRDISLSVDFFTGAVVAPMALMDIAPCPPDGVPDFRDIAETVNAFIELPYPCSLPCP